MLELMEKYTTLTDPQTGNVQNVLSRLYAGVLDGMFSDCPKVTKQLSSLRLIEPALIRVVKEYNQCIRPEQKMVEAKVAKLL